VHRHEPFLHSRQQLPSRGVSPVKSVAALTRQRGNSSVKLAIVVAVLMVVALSVLPISAYRPQIISVIYVLIFAFAWQPVAGVLGEFSMAHVVAWAGGAYTVILALNNGWVLPLALLACIAVGFVIGLVTIGLIVLARVSGLYIAVFTLIVVQIVQAYLSNSDRLGGPVGISIREFPLSDETTYLLLVVFAAIQLVCVALFVASRRGLVWIAIRDEAPVASGLGWSVLKERTIAYAVTATACALGGALQGLSAGFAIPESTLSLETTVVALIAIYLLGASTWWGPFVGVLFFQGLTNAIQRINPSPDTAQVASLVQYAIALIVVYFAMAERVRRAGPATESSPRVPADAESVEGERLPEGKEATLEDVADARTRDGGPLRVKSLKIAFGGNQVLRDVSFELSPGEILGLVGPNGAGKSTICNLVSGHLRPDGGGIALGGRDVRGLQSHERARLGLGRTYQTPRVFGSLSLAQNVLVTGKEVTRKDALTLLEGLGIDDPDRLASTATLMERRLVEIARILAVDWKWVLLDEPMAGLTATEHDVILGHIKALSQMGVGVLLIEHLIPVIAPVVDRMIVLDSGVLIASGKPVDVLQNKAVIDAYLGEPLILAESTELESDNDGAARS
jgi:ABC-type branched-subunit amino acid transport system ATPase component/ABC-type branched-subunit amino acid transport system permease subunit